MRLNHIATVLLFASLVALIGFSQADASLVQTSSFAAGDVLPNVSPNLNNDLLLQPTTFLANVSRRYDSAANPLQQRRQEPRPKTTQQIQHRFGDRAPPRITLTSPRALRVMKFRRSACSAVGSTVAAIRLIPLTILWSAPAAATIQHGARPSASAPIGTGELSGHGLGFRAARGAPSLRRCRVELNLLQGSPPNNNSFAGTGTVFRQVNH